MRNVDQVTAQIEKAINGNLTDEQHEEIELWIKGRSLATTVSTPGWEVILEMLQSYVAKSIQKLATIDPAKKDEVAAEHAVYYTANQIVRRFVEDVDYAIQYSRKTPDVVKSVASPVPPESIG